MVISTVNQVLYNGDGITTAWPYTFRIIDATDIKLTIIDADGTETDVSADYFVDTVNNTVYYPGYAPGAEPPEEEQPAPVQSGQKLLIYRQLPVTQEKDLGDKWPFFVIELALDKLTMILQQVAGWWDRCLKISPASEAEHPGFNMTFPIEAGKSFRVNAEGTGFEASEDPGIAAEAAYEALEKAEEAKDAAISAQEAAEAAAALVELQAVWYDTVADLVADDISAGNTAGTKGYYAIGDGGNSLYNIREKTVSDVDDGGSIIFLDNGNVAELITDGTVNVKQFGAVGDGVTNDGQSIQNAIDYGVKNVVFPEGTYLYTQLYLESNQCFKGENATLIATIIPVADLYSSTNIYANEKENITFDGFVFDGNTQTDLRHVLSFFTCTNIKFVDCEFTRGYGYILRINNSENVVIDNCYAHDITGSTGNPGGFLFGVSFTNLTVQNCHCQNLDDHMVYVTGNSKHICVENCKAVSTGLGEWTNGAAYCIYGNTTDVFIDNCVARSCQNGFNFANYTGYDSAPSYVVVSNCIAKYSVQNGFSVMGDDGHLCQNVLISKCMAINSGQDGFGIRYTRNVTIDNCTIVNFARYGIECSTTEYMKLTGNYLKNTTADADYPIIFGNLAYASNNLLFNNIFDSISYTNYCAYFRTVTGVKGVANNYNTGSAAISN